MNRILAVLVGSLFLVGCSGSDDLVVNYNELPIESYDLFDGDEFRIQYPKDWEIVNQTELGERYKSGAQIAFIDNNKDAFFTPNMIVEKFDIANGESLDKVYDAVWDDNQNNLLIVEEVGRQNFTTIASGKVASGLIVEFTGKRKLEGDVLVYLQSLLLDGNEAWVTTVAFDELDTDTQGGELVESLKTFATK